MVPWLRFGGLLVSAWVFGAVFTSQCADGGSDYCESALTELLFIPAGLWLAPILLGILWIWSPLERSGSVAGATLLTGLLISFQLAKAVPDPGPDGITDTGFILMFFGTLFYALYAGLTWLVLWLIGRKLERF